MRVIKKQGLHHSRLTAGKEYEVLETNDKSHWYTVTNDGGDVARYSQSRFDVVQVSPVEPQPADVVQVSPVHPTPTYEGELYDIVPAPQPPTERATMKVLCVSTKGSAFLTLGKEYDNI